MRPADSDVLHFDAAVFDLDGVITDTARLHAAAWKAMADDYLEARERRTGEVQPPFDAAEDYRRWVDGKPRQEGLRSFLESRGIRLPPGSPQDPPGAETIHGLADRKDELFRRRLDDDGVELFQGTVGLIEELRSRGVRTAVASSSRNCRRILARAGIEALFEARVDGETLRDEDLQGKPHPDMFLETTRRLGVDPRRSIVFEDAVSGVEAGIRAGFGLVVGVTGEPAVRVPLREAGAHLLWNQDEMDALTPEVLDAWFRHDEHRRPPVLGHWDRFVADMAGRRPAVFLDYDGTLTPIVSRPEDAVLSEAMRDAVRRVAQRFPTTVVSGRGRDDVAGLVGLNEVHYAGSHGFDIQGAGDHGEELRHEAAADAEPVIDQVTRRLREELKEIDGALVEPKRFTVAVHYRMVDESKTPRVEAAVDAALERHPEIRKAHGKKVFELRPDLDWDKGRAVAWLLEALELDGGDVVPLYLGDDTTDEDAFRALEDRGIGIVVWDRPRPTRARYQLQDADEVGAFLARLADLGDGP